MQQRRWRTFEFAMQEQCRSTQDPLGIKPMRLWSLHPEYLDTRGIVALWREALLAQAVLRGSTRGYRRHPQLERFRAADNPLHAIATYLSGIQKEAARRAFNFDESKIGPGQTARRIPVSKGQMNYELAHLKTKLAQRDAAALQRLNSVKRVEPHPLFKLVSGAIENWERVKVDQT